MSSDYEVSGLLEHRRRVTSTHSQSPLNAGYVDLVVVLELAQVVGLQIGSGPIGFQLAAHQTLRCIGSDEHDQSSSRAK